jgi:hypothetical protein
LQLGELSPKVRGLIHAQKDRNPAFDLIGYDREDLRNIPFLDRKAALARLLRDAKVGILLNEQIAEDGLTVFAQACQLGAEGIVSKKVDNSYRSGRRGNVIVVRISVDEGEAGVRLDRSKRPCFDPKWPSHSPVGLCNGRPLSLRR